jgi:hypothetical protein
MNILESHSPIHPYFRELPEDVQQKGLKLINEVNELHLHCDNPELWKKVHLYITLFFAVDYKKKIQKKSAINPPDRHINASPKPNDAVKTSQKDPKLFRSPLNQSAYDHYLQQFVTEIESIFHDPQLTKPVIEALQKHIMTPLASNRELVQKLMGWFIQNALFLPLGVHLFDSYLQDMQGKTVFSNAILPTFDLEADPESLSLQTQSYVKAFLSEVGEANSRTSASYNPDPVHPTAVVLSVKNGAGGHTAPHQAMEARLKERGWRVHTILCDVDMSSKNDPFYLLHTTFADPNQRMTKELFNTLWRLPKQNRDVADIVEYYIRANMVLKPELFEDESGGDLLRKTIIPLKPHVIITTCAYHWSWKALAYRIPHLKVLLAASDVFFHFSAFMPWARQVNFDPNMRHIHFTAMTEDLKLLRSEGDHHDQYFLKKYPDYPLQAWRPAFKHLVLDSQISVIGAPINPAFDITTDEGQIKRLKIKWGIPENCLSICLSRGKLGFTKDFNEALNGYQTQEKLALPVILNVVCGHNEEFYEQLTTKIKQGWVLGPNITVVAHRLLAPKEFAELRSISTIDDIKAGGGSTFEGWYLRSKGLNMMLLLTPGPTLWWENSNCDAMEEWGVGRVSTEKTNKISILKDILQNGLPKVTHLFPDWKAPFDQCMDTLITTWKPK